MRRAWVTLEGRSLELSGVMQLGRDERCALRLADERVALHHGHFEQRGDDFWFIDGGSALGTWLERNGVVHGRVGQVLLEDGDVLTGLPPSVQFRRERVTDELCERLERSLVEQPDDAGRWAVYADRLLELGDPRAARILEAPVRWPEPGPLISEGLAAGAISLEWAFGHVRAATLRDLDGGWGDRAVPLSTVVRAVCGADRCRFLVELRLELQSPLADAVRHVRAAFEACQLPALRRLEVSPRPLDGVAWKTAARTF